MSPSITVTKSKNIVRAPQSYKVFAKSITNNEKANSTLVTSAELECNFENSRQPASKRRNNHSKRVRFKPGPLSYKRRLLQHQEILDDDDMNVPIMLNERSPLLDRNSRNLETIIERIDEKSQTPQAEVNFDIHSIELEEVGIIEPHTIHNLNEARQYLGSVERVNESESITTHSDQEKDSVIQKGDTNTRNRAITIRNKIIQKRLPESKVADVENLVEQEDNLKSPNRTEHTKIHFEGITTIVSHNTCQRQHERKCGSSEENRDEQDTTATFELDTRFMKIVARTVHIHNHFYKT